MVIAGIVLFEPDEERLRENIESIVNQVDSIICVDNDSKNYLRTYQNVLSKYEKIIVIKNNVNIGIAAALNKIFMFAKEAQAEWVLTLDQDTVCPNRIIERYMKYANDDRVAILTPVFVDRNHSRVENVSDDVSRVERCITSASLNRVRDWELVEGFNESLFIDFVDHDYCMRILKSGRLILKINSVIVLHEIGKAKEYNFGGLNLITLNHPPIRKYYIIRNWLFYIRTYKKEVRVMNELIKVIAFILKTLIFEANKIKNISAFVKGIRDSKNLGIETR